METLQYITLREMYLKIIFHSIFEFSFFIRCLSFITSSKKIELHRKENLSNNIMLFSYYSFLKMYGNFGNAVISRKLYW